MTKRQKILLIVSSVLLIFSFAGFLTYNLILADRGLKAKSTTTGVAETPKKEELQPPEQENQLPSGQNQPSQESKDTSKEQTLKTPESESTPQETSQEQPTTQPTLFPIEIRGDETCLSQTNEALALLQSRAETHYNVAMQYIGILECAEQGSGIYVWENPPRYKAGRSTREADSLWYASTFAHEACHAKQYQEGRNYSGREGEAECLNVQADALEKLGASQSTLDYIRNVINTEYWEVPYSERWW